MTVQTAAPDLIPTRFRAGEARNAKIGRTLRVVGRVRSVDEDLMALIGRRFMERDEVGAALVHAMRAAGPGRVSMAQVRQALAHGIETVEAAPAALQDFFTVVDAVPDWVDFDLINEGSRVYRRFGANAADVLTQLALVGGYRWGGPTDLLVATGGLSGDTTMRRLGETQKWAIAVSEPDSMRRDGEGFQLTVHVRLMHAMINDRFETGGRWDTAKWGLPINQSDLAGTLGLFNAVLLLGVRLLGVRVSKADSRAVMHLWKYIGWLIGVDADWLCDSERRQHQLNYHIVLAQGDVTKAGQQLANAIVTSQSDMHYERFEGVRRQYERARLLSMLRAFLGKQGMRDLALPVRPPWAIAGVIPLNLWRYQVLGRTQWGEQMLQRRATEDRAERLRRHFGADRPQVADLPG